MSNHNFIANTSVNITDFNAPQGNENAPFHTIITSLSKRYNMRGRCATQTTVQYCASIEPSLLPLFIFCIKNFSISFSATCCSAVHRNSAHGLKNMLSEANQIKYSWNNVWNRDIKSVYIVELVIISLVFLRSAHARRFSSSCVVAKFWDFSILALRINGIYFYINWFRHYSPCPVHSPDSLFSPSFQ